MIELRSKKWDKFISKRKILVDQKNQLCRLKHSENKDNGIVFIIVFLVTVDLEWRI